MQIALFHNTPSGGAKRAIYEWTQRLARSHAIDVYTLSTANHDFCDIRPYVKSYSVFEFSPSRLYERPFGRLNQLQRWRDLGRLKDLHKCIAAQIDRGDYDVVFAHTCIYTHIPALLQFLETPSVYYLHEPFGRTFARHFQREYLSQNEWRVILDRYDPAIALFRQRLDHIHRQSVTGTSLLLANSYFTQQEIGKAFSVDAPICHYGVNSSRFRPSDNVARQAHVLSVGELSPRKGFDFLVDSIGRIPQSERPVLRIVCNSILQGEKTYVEALADRRNVELQVLTNLNSEELAEQYNQARLCIYAPVREPFGLVPLEAMACGTPVIGVREGGVCESVVHEHTGLLVERDPSLFAAAVRQLLSDPARCAAYGRNGRNHVLHHWTWERSTAEVEHRLELCAAL